MERIFRNIELLAPEDQTLQQFVMRLLHAKEESGLLAGAVDELELARGEHRVFVERELFEATFPRPFLLGGGF